MPYLTITEPQLKRAFNRATYNPRGYILIEWGDYGQHHFRLDLERFGPNNRYQMLAGNGRDYEYRISSLHLKKEVQYAPRRDRRDDDPINDEWNYFYVVCMGGGVWQPVWGYVKQENIDTRRTGRVGASAAEQADGYRLVTSLLDDLGQATGTVQGIACGPLASPSQVPGGIIPG